MLEPSPGDVGITAHGRDTSRDGTNEGIEVLLMLLTRVSIGVDPV